MKATPLWGKYYLRFLFCQCVHVIHHSRAPRSLVFASASLASLATPACSIPRGSVGPLAWQADDKQVSDPQLSIE